MWSEIKIVLRRLFADSRRAAAVIGILAVLGVGLIVWASLPSEKPLQPLIPASDVTTPDTLAPPVTAAPVTTAPDVGGEQACLTWPLCKLQHGYCKHHCLDNPPEPCDTSGCQVSLEATIVAVGVHGEQAVRDLLDDHGITEAVDADGRVHDLSVCKGCDNQGAFCKSLGWPACCLCHADTVGGALSPEDLSQCYHDCEDTIHCGSTKKTTCACSYACHYSQDPSTWGQWCNRSNCPLHADAPDGVTGDVCPIP